MSKESVLAQDYKTIISERITLRSNFQEKAVYTNPIKADKMNLTSDGRFIHGKILKEYLK